MQHYYDIFLKFQRQWLPFRHVQIVWYFKSLNSIKLINWIAWKCSIFSWATVLTKRDSSVPNFDVINREVNAANKTVLNWMMSLLPPKSCEHNKYLYIVNMIWSKMNLLTNLSMGIHFEQPKSRWIRAESKVRRTQRIQHRWPSTCTGRKN